MKKVLCFLFVLFLIWTLSAETSATWKKGESSAEASIPMTLDLTSSGNFDRIIVGFSNNSVTGFNPLVTSGVSAYLLAPGDDGIARNNTSSSLYVFWQIQSAQELDISLYAAKPLTYTGTGTFEGNINKIYFDVEGTKEGVTGSNPVTFVDGVVENGTSESGYGSPIENVYVYEHKPASNVGNAGSYKLTITTEDYRSKVMGSYTADLIVKIVAVGN